MTAGPALKRDGVQANAIAAALIARQSDQTGPDGFCRSISG